MSTKNSNQLLVPESKKALDTMKVEVANELGIPNYDKIDKGNLTARQNGYVGGTIVKNMIKAYEEGLK